MDADSSAGAGDVARQCEVWNQKLFDTNPLPMIVYDPGSLKILKVNDSAVQVYGYPASEWLGMSVMDLYLAEDRDAAASGLGEARDGDFHHAGNWRQLSKDRIQLDVEVFQCQIPFDGKEAALALFQDVTELRRAERDISQTQRIAKLGSWVMTPPENSLRWSDQEFRNFGLEPQSAAPTYEEFMHLVHPEDRQTVSEHVAQALSDGKLENCAHRVVWPDGSTHVIQAQGAVVLDRSGRRQFIGTCLDVTEQKLVEEQLLQTKADLTKAQEIAKCGTWTLDVANDRCMTTSAETLQLFGLPSGAAEISSATLFERVHPDDHDLIRQARARAFADPEGRYDVEYRVLRPTDGQELIVHSMGQASFDAEGKPVRMVGIAQDVTEKRQAEERIRRLAFHDEVTGLPNRSLLRQELEARLGVAPAVCQPLALLLVSMSRLRDINFTLGHANGDILLKEVGMRIRQAVKPKDLVARTGTAQFAIMLPDATASDAAARIRNLVAVLEEPFSIADISYGLGAHIGIALAPGHGTDPDTILRKADVALYEARQSGQVYAFYEPALDPYNPQRLALMGEFRHAISAGQLELYCQPKANIRSGEIIGAEALVRWQHPKYGLIGPDRFIPLIEPTEMIHPLTDFMLQAAAKQFYAWQRQGFHIPLAVNLSARDLNEPDLASNLKYLLLTWGVEAAWLGLEITESSLMVDPAASIEELHRLSKMGFRLFVDDFGTGYSSLNYLTKLPINVIKIDHGFTMHMIDDKGAEVIVKSTIDLAHNLGMTVIAEGTANREIWDALAKLGCDEAQGEFIAHPLPAQEFISQLQAANFHFASRPEGRAH